MSNSEDRRAKVCHEIIQIMETYDEQIERNGYVDTPGGLEHMGFFLST